MKSKVKPSVGLLVTVRSVRCRIVKVRAFGTIDVVSMDGRHAWRLSGLKF